MTIQELKRAIVDEVATIEEDLRRCVYGSFQTRLQQCTDVNGRIYGRSRVFFPVTVYYL
jgi:hypothetical protein